jgi:hypothetical protein
MAAPVKASLTTAMTGTNNDIVLTSRWNAGKTIALTLVDPGTPNSDPSISVDEQNGEIVVQLRRAGSAIATTLDELICLINGSHPSKNNQQVTPGEQISLQKHNPAAARLAHATRSGADDGTGVVTALARTALSGGVDASFGSKAEAETVFQTISWVVDGEAKLELRLAGSAQNTYQLFGSDASKLPALNQIYNDLARKGRAVDVIAA